MPSPTVSFIIVSYNTCAELRACLWSLRRVADEAVAEIIVVDNCSSDGSATMIEAEFRNVKLIGLNQNIGFAAGVNRGVAVSEADWCFVLNPDTIVPRGTISKLIEAARQLEQVGALGCSLHQVTGEPLASEFRMPTLFREFWNLLPELKGVLRIGRLGQRLLRSEMILDKESQTTEFRSVEAISGAAMLLRRKAYDAIGGFDERFFLYHEEVDLCLRLRAGGWEVLTYQACPIIHLNARSTGYRMDRLPADPILTWRISGMALLWRKQKRRSAYLAWKRQTRALLRLRRIVLGACLTFAFGPRRVKLADRRRELGKLSDRLRAMD